MRNKEYDKKHHIDGDSVTKDWREIHSKHPELSDNFDELENQIDELTYCFVRGNIGYEEYRSKIEDLYIRCTMMELINECLENIHTNTTEKDK